MPERKIDLTYIGHTVQKPLFSPTEDGIPWSKEIVSTNYTYDQIVVAVDIQALNGCGIDFTLDGEPLITKSFQSGGHTILYHLETKEMSGCKP